MDKLLNSLEKFIFGKDNKDTFVNVNSINNISKTYVTYGFCVDCNRMQPRNIYGSCSICGSRSILITWKKEDKQ